MSDKSVDELWVEFVKLERAFTAQAIKLLAKGGRLTQMLKRALDKPDERSAALFVIERLGEDGQRELFNEVLALTFYVHGFTERCRRIIVSMPRQWVLEHIEAHAGQILREAGQEEYRAAFELYLELDKELARRLSERALQHSDPEIREAGEDFAHRLEITRA